MSHTPHFTSRLRRLFLPSTAVLARRLSVSAAALALGALASGCDSGGGGGGSGGSGGDTCKGSRSTTVYSSKLTTSRIERVDLLLDVDNSRSMADKQAILAMAVPDLVRGFVNPPCINPVTGQVDSVPASPLDACPAGTQRKIQPISDIHVGVISSSLGGHGSDACGTAGAGNGSNDDKAHLLARQDPNNNTAVETYQDLHFLAWDPKQALTPPGEADLEQDSPADPNGTALVPQLRDLLVGVGQIGCGYESQLESWYRFLVDPSPAESFAVDANGSVQATGIDNALLQQRKAFLRPDSLLEIILLTDENDCSIRESGQFYLAAQQVGPNGAPFHLPRARAVCDADPGNECCFSCGQTGPKNADGTPKCAEDPVCKTPDGQIVLVDAANDSPNLRCYDQKRRFGIDFLYGTDRYVEALHSPTVTDRNGNVVPSPLFTDLDPSDGIAAVRDASMVLFAGIVGVPWQDIARTDANGAPDLLNGRDAQGRAVGGYRSASEMFTLPGKDYGTWDVLLGNPEVSPNQPPSPRDPLMIESIAPRTGQNPITGDATSPPNTPLGNPMNGNERTIAANDDLQYACVFPLVKMDANGAVVPDARDCSAAAGDAGCDCADPNNDSPLCEVDPSTGQRTLQVRAKAYPGLRVLQVLKEVGSQGIVGSACPAQLANPAAADFGYRPAVAGLDERLKSSLAGRCLSITLTPNVQGEVPCAIVEARSVPAAEVASCNACTDPGRAPVNALRQPMVDELTQSNPAADFNCFCEIQQIAAWQDENQPPCQYDPSSAPVHSNGEPLNGFCYVDQAQNVGDPALVEQCPADEKRLLRFVGAGAPKSGSTVLATCVGETVYPPDPACVDGQ